MRGVSGTVETCTALLMVCMFHRFKCTLLGLEVQCLKGRGLSLLDHMVVVLGEDQVEVKMTLDLVAEAFSPTALADHALLIVVIAFLKWDMV